MQRFLLSVLFLFIPFTTAFSKGRDTVGVYKGETFRYSLRIPAGWVLDKKVKAKDGMPFVFYIKGKSWDTSPAVIYTYTQELDTAIPVYKLINDDSRRMVMQIAHLKAKHVRPFTSGERAIQVVHYLSDEEKMYDAVAYIPENLTIIRVVLSAKTREAFDKGLIAFEESLRSYIFATTSK